MSHQTLLLDISTASARSKGQALRYAEPKGTQRQRKPRRNDLHREKAKAPLPLPAIAEQMTQRDDSTQTSLEEAAGPLANDKSTLSMLGSQFETVQREEDSLGSIEVNEESQHPLIASSNYPKDSRNTIHGKQMERSGNFEKCRRRTSSCQFLSRKLGWIRHWQSVRRRRTSRPGNET